LLLSFPLHPPGRPEASRAAELALAPAPTFVVQGSTDPFGTPSEVRPHAPAGATVLEVPGAHSFPRGSRVALVDALTEAAGMLPGAVSLDPPWRPVRRVHPSTAPP
ncbi:MAG: hypothetical protein JWP82_1770, partial [Humibacillus sp.]|nr:hypothetical protein [Humibacillus sp.]